MKKLSYINKMIYFINYIFAILLLLGFALPLMAPSTAPKLAIMSLAMPILFIINIVFAIYWLIGLKPQFFLSLVCLVLGYFVSSPYYNLSEKNVKTPNEISIMNYNVRLFNVYNWIEDKEIPTKIAKFIKIENPDILCVQEYHLSGDNKNKIIDYPYKYIKIVSKKAKFGQAIFSKYKIINQGSLGFKNTQNNAIYVDILKKRDTIRIYNIHLESLGLNVEKENFGEKNSERLVARLSKEFVKQQQQVEQIKKHQKKCKYPVIISGDLNNTAYSWTYKNIKSNMKDSFLKAGTGFGKTFEIKRFPMRIDFIFADGIFTINEHKNYKVNYSDHKPIMARIGL